MEGAERLRRSQAGLNHLHAEILRHLDDVCGSCEVLDEELAFSAHLWFDPLKKVMQDAVSVPMVGP